jgi:hypothetical protein
MRRFFFFGSSPPANAVDDGNKTPGDDSTSKYKKKLRDSDGNESTGSCATRTSRSRRSRRGKLNNQQLSSNPKQLRRSMSFSSPPTKNRLGQRTFSFSGDAPCSLYDDSDGHQHTGDVE